MAVFLSTRSVPVFQVLLVDAFSISKASRFQVTPINRRLLSTKHEGHASPHTDKCQNHDDPLNIAQTAFSFLAGRAKTWKRLGPLVDLGCSIAATPNSFSVADIGCDHGLLTVGLAVSGKFKNVVGIDVSPQALQGGLALQDTLYKRMAQRDQQMDLNIQFRLGNGMEALQDNETDVICLAGMGVNTMKTILTENELNRIGCQHILLQPTNSRPRNMCKVYDHLQDIGWRLESERIDYLSRRWYISSMFSKIEISTCICLSDDRNVLPGARLETLDECDPMRYIYKDYLAHHFSWLQKDLKVTNIGKDDKRWLNALQSKFGPEQF